MISTYSIFQSIIFIFLTIIQFILYFSLEISLINFLSILICVFMFIIIVFLVLIVFVFFKFFSILLHLSSYFSFFFFGHWSGIHVSVFLFRSVHSFHYSEICHYISVFVFCNNSSLYNKK